MSLTCLQRWFKVRLGSEAAELGRARRQCALSLGFSRSGNLHENFDGIGFQNIGNPNQLQHINTSLPDFIARDKRLRLSKLLGELYLGETRAPTNGGQYAPYTPIVLLLNPHGGAPALAKRPQ